MATLRRRGQRWHVQVRRKGRTPVTRSFRLKSNALAWAREQELEADQGRPLVHKTLRGITVADIVVRYRDEIVPRKRGADREALTLNAFLRHPLARVAVADVTTGMASAYCAERLRRVKPGTINREPDILRHAFATARRSWDIPLARNAFADGDTSEEPCSERATATIGRAKALAFGLRSLPQPVCPFPGSVST